MGEGEGVGVKGLGVVGRRFVLIAPVFKELLFGPTGHVVYRWLAVVIYILDSRRSAHACLCTHSRIFSFQL